MNAVISTDLDYALHIRATWRIECLGDAFEEHFKAGRSGMNDHLQQLITAIAICMPRSARKESRAADGHFRPLTILPEFHTTFENVKHTHPHVCASAGAAPHRVESPLGPS